MSAEFNIDIELQKTFHAAIRLNAAGSLKHGDDWQQLQQIEKRFDEDRQEIQQKYEAEYVTRVGIVSKRLINKAGEREPSPRPPIGTDRFNPDAINAQAHREVQRDHERVLQQSRDNEQSAIESLQDAARQRDLPRGLVKEKFNQARDRRSTPERRR